MEGSIELKDKQGFYLLPLKL